MRSSYSRAQWASRVAVTSSVRLLANMILARVPVRSGDKHPKTEQHTTFTSVHGLSDVDEFLYITTAEKSWGS